MKHRTIWLLCGILALALTACQSQPAAENPFSQNAAQIQQEVFSSLHMAEGNIPAVRLEATVTENEAPFFYIETAEDTEVTLYYNFTKDAGDAWIGCYSENGSENNTIPLDSSAVTTEISNELTLSLKKGMHVFYITGNSCHCTLRLELNGLDSSNILYADTLPKDDVSTDIQAEA